MPHFDKLRRILRFFRKPDEELVERILGNLGVESADPDYEELKAGLSGVIGKESRQEECTKFFSRLSHDLYEKTKERLAAKDEEIAGLKKELFRAEDELKRDVLTAAFSPEILAIYDPPSLEILGILQSGEESYRSLKRESHLQHKDLRWRLEYFDDLGLIEANLSRGHEVYSLSNTGKEILQKRREDFAKIANLLKNDEKYQLALKASGEDRVNAHRFLSWLEGSKGISHMGIIGKLSKRFDDPKRISQRFFSEREQGVSHEKHIGIKIVDHTAAGELLLLQLEEMRVHRFVD